MKKLLCLALMSLLLSACSALNYIGLGDEEKKPDPSLVMIDHGIYENGALKLPTNSVPKKLGSTFGFRFKAVKPVGGQLSVTIVTNSPGMINPTKKEVEFKTENQQNLLVGEEYNCTFTFEQEWEMVSGDWTLEVVAQDGTKISQTFQVFNPQM